jgi:hypothetical protein
MVLDTRLVVILMIVTIGSTVTLQTVPNVSVAYASESSPYDSGYDHGCDDAGLRESEKYINQDEKGPAFHTQEFLMP